MGFFRFAYSQSSKSVGKGLLFALLLATIFTISAIFGYVRFLNYSSSDDFKNSIKNEIDCTINNYQLTCDENYREFEFLVIDLDNSHTHYKDDLVLTRTTIYFGERDYTYEEIFDRINYNKSSFTVDDLSAYLHDIVQGLGFIYFMGCFVFSYIFYIVGNTVLAAIMMLLINGIFKKNFLYKQMYTLTLYVILPYVLLNGILRSIFDQTLSGYIGGFIPFIGAVVTILIDYAFIFGLTYLALKDSFNKTDDGIVEDFQSNYV